LSEHDDVIAPLLRGVPRLGLSMCCSETRDLLLNSADGVLRKRTHLCGTTRAQILLLLQCRAEESTVGISNSSISRSGAEF